MSGKDEQIKSEPIDGAVVREVLRRLGMKPMEGGNNNRFEIWLTDTGHPECLPYYKTGDKDRFLKHAFDQLVERLA